MNPVGSVLNKVVLVGNRHPRLSARILTCPIEFTVDTVFVIRRALNEEVLVILLRSGVSPHSEAAFGIVVKEFGEQIGLVTTKLLTYWIA